MEHKFVQEVKVKYPPCVKCPANPRGQKCPFKLCRKCCEIRIKTEQIDCLGHKLLRWVLANVNFYLKSELFSEKTKQERQKAWENVTKWKEEKWTKLLHKLWIIIYFMKHKIKFSYSFKLLNSRIYITYTSKTLCCDHFVRNPAEIEPLNCQNLISSLTIGRLPLINTWFATFSFNSVLLL